MRVTTLTLLALSLVIVMLAGSGRNAWGWITAYWLVVVIRNGIDCIREASGK